MGEEMDTQQIIEEYATLVGTLRGLVVSMRHESLPAGYLEEAIRKLSAESSARFDELVGGK